MLNHSNESCIYLDICHNPGVDVCEYPDSNKINAIPHIGIFKKNSSVGYFKDEKNVAKVWEELKTEKNEMDK